MEVICIIDANVTVKSHPSDSKLTVISVGGTDYSVDAHDLLNAVINTTNK